jgi:hypothetical protein
VVSVAELVVELESVVGVLVLLVLLVPVLLVRGPLCVAMVDERAGA